VREKGLKKDCGTEIVHAHVAVDLVHALAHPDLGGEMNDFINAAYGTRYGIFVTDVTVYDFNRIEHWIRSCRAPVNLLDKAIENANLPTFSQ
jgi:hypothetical protein